jgi:glycosyltransferase involved in cell wall biosynthesis
MHVAMLGTRGVPAQYGGFETAVEEVGSRLVQRGHAVTVYCRNPGQQPRTFKGMDLVSRPALRRRSLETLSHTLLSVAHAVRARPDAAVLFNAANAPYLPLLTRCHIPTAVHIDGLEWKRAKWTGAGAKYYKWAEALAVRSNAVVIADAQGIADYVAGRYGKESVLIPYGAPILTPGRDLLNQVGLQVNGYHLVVARLEPENHVHLIVEGYRTSNSDAPLVVVGSAPYQDAYIAQLRSLAQGADVRFVGGIWDQDLLNQLYANARSYLHGHSVGGTNPSLLRALGCAAPVTAYDVNFNREVTGGHARFFSSISDVAGAISADDEYEAIGRGADGRDYVAKHYRWDDVTDRYEAMLRSMVGN